MAGRPRNWIVMKTHAFRFAYVLLGLAAGLTANAETPAPAVAADQGKVAISIGNQPPKVFGSVELGGLPRTTVAVKGMDGRSRKYAGVALYDLLASAGMELGGEQRPAALTTFLWVEGSDGYRVLFSGAEVHRYIGGGEVLLADSQDGQPISKAEGPYRLVVTGDKVRARWLRQVRALYVVQAPPPAEPGK